MTKTEWEKKNNYSNRHNCAHCKHMFFIETDPYERGPLKCLKKKETGAGEGVKSNYSCDLWIDEKEIKNAV